MDDCRCHRSRRGSWRYDLWMSLESRVVTAADEALRRQKFVTAIDVCTGIGWLPGTLVINWRQGRVDTLEEVLRVRPERIALVLEYLEHWAKEQGLTPTETEYITSSRDRRQLRFTRAGDPKAE